MTDLSILIPARNEMFLARTVKDITTNMRGDTEVIVVLDGARDNPKIEEHPKVNIIYHSSSIGQRASINDAAKISTAKYILKCDAHCAFDEGFDVKLLADMQDDWTVAPTMRNLHVFDWVCQKCGQRKYQDITPTQCAKCDNTTDFKRDIVWIAKTNPQSNSYRFDTDLHFQYFGVYNTRTEGKGQLTESMSLQGSCFMSTRKKFFELELCDEKFGSWGQQGVEVACKTWLSGGRVIVNHNTWYAHMFRTKGGDFGFPYPLSGKQVEYARDYSKKLFIHNTWEKQIYPLSWLIEKFKPVPDWHDQHGKEMLDLVESEGKRFYETRGQIKSDRPISQDRRAETETIQGNSSTSRTSRPFGIIYYTDNQLRQDISTACQRQLLKYVEPEQIVSVSLKPIDFGKNITLDLERGYLTMFKQILAGLETTDADIVFFCEHDVLYHPSHFDFVPTRKDIYYYNLNMWKVDAETGHALHYDTKQTSGLCAYRELLLQHYRERVSRTERKLAELGDTREYRNWIRRQGFEPGSHGRTERVDDYKSDIWYSEYSNIDIRHNTNLTSSRWKQEQFRDQRNCQNWQEAEEVIGWYEPGKFGELLNGLTST